MTTVPHEQVMLDALGHEIAEHPERLVPVDAALIERLQTKDRRERKVVRNG